MEMAEHAPGPWKVFIRCNSDGLPEVVVASDNGCPIAVVGNHAEFKETARLIAAAPDLLSLVLQYRDDLHHPPAPDSRERRLQAIEAAIAKATAA